MIPALRRVCRHFAMRDGAFRRKLLCRVAVALALALATSGGSVLLHTAIKAREGLVTRLRSQTEIVAANLTAAMAFSDAAAANEVLTSFSRDPDIVVARVLRPDGTEFAAYARTNRPTSHRLSELPGPDDHLFTGSALVLSRSVELDGDLLGRVVVQCDLRAMQRQLWQGIGLICTVLVVALVLSLLYVMRQLRVLTRPMDELGRTVRGILSDGNYDRRATKISDDEFGALTEAFNDMIAQIQSRDVALNRVMSDLEARVRARTAALEQSNERNRVILQTALDAVIIMNEAGVVTGWNPQAVATFGWTEQEAIGRRLTELIIPPDLREAHERGMERLLRTGVATILGQRAEVEAINKDGRRFPVELSVNAVRAGGETLFSGFVRDITERRAREAELRDARDAAEAANHAKSAFLANMSHEIRTPMTAILGFVEMLQDGTSDPTDRHEAIRTIRRNGEHLLQIINDVLDLSKIEAGRLELQLAPQSLEQIIRDVTTLMRDRAEGKGLRFIVQCPMPLPSRIVTDDMRLRQVLINLLGNAVKFTDQGSVRLVVRMTGEDEGRPRLRFDIADTGIGIAPDQLRHLFQPFAQVDSTMSRQYGGTGLGLAISRQLATQLNGAISVDSSPGRGSTFTLEMDPGDLSGVPRITPNLASDVDEPHTTVPKPAARRIWPGRRALLVEDGPDNQRLIAHFLKSAQLTVEFAANGIDGVDAALAAECEGQPFDIVLMDMQMPVLDGYDATRRLREAGYPRPIIALTAHAMRGDRENCLEAGCDEYASKPIDRSALLDLIASLLDSTGANERPDRSGTANGPIAVKSSGANPTSDAARPPG